MKNSAITKRKIAVVTGSRCSYSIYRSVLQAITEHPLLELALIVANMHLSKEYGLTINEIKNEYDITETVDMLLSSDSEASQARGVGLGILGFTQCFERIKPDIILVQGDRGETIAAAIAGAHLNIPVAHMHGGEINGTIDELIRHATTKFSHLHFPATKKSAERIIKMGEDPWRVHVVGAAGIDNINNKDLISAEAIAKKYNLNLSKPMILLLQHPCSTEVEQSGFQLEQTLEAIKEIGEQTIIIYPNADAGNKAMINAIRTATPELTAQGIIKGVFKNLNHIDYLSLLKVSSVMVGNSSGAIIEAPFFGVPTVDIGTRQKNREKTETTFEVGYNCKEIVNAIRKALTDTKYRDSVKNVKSPYDPYGTTDAGKRIVKILSSFPLDNKLLLKQIFY